MSVTETAMGTPVHAQESADSKYVTAIHEWVWTSFHFQQLV